MNAKRFTGGLLLSLLGALTAFVGMESVKPGGTLMPWLVFASGALAGVAVRSKLKRASRTAGPAASFDSRSGSEAALIGHELKNYLCTLKGNAQLLRPRVSGADQAIIDRIDRVVEKLESFTRDLADGRSAAPGCATARPGEAARACVLTHFPERANLFRFAGELDAAVSGGDGARLDQIFLNLYANAFEAGAERISTEVRRSQDRVLVRIEDDGRGCAREDMERIFEPFFTTKTGPVRRGLGMFIVHSIVESRGGRIRVETKNGGPGGASGLVFTLDFPAPRTGAVLRPISTAPAFPATAAAMPTMTATASMAPAVATAATIATTAMADTARSAPAVAVAPA